MHSLWEGKIITGNMNQSCMAGNQQHDIIGILIDHKLPYGILINHLKMIYIQQWNLLISLAILYKILVKSEIGSWIYFDDLEAPWSLVKRQTESVTWWSSMKNMHKLLWKDTMHTPKEQYLSSVLIVRLISNPYLHSKKNSISISP